MYRKYLKGKIHGARVSETNINYSGSITVDLDLMDAAGLAPFEMVTVVNVTNAERFETYVIEGERGSGYIGLNGGAAKKGEPGDTLIIFSSIWAKKGRKIDVKVIISDSSNKVKESRVTRIVT
ncbi:MAG: aspartate 1-decarboxylase [Elusimicrobia bacterium]|nr:aspartate 1-decarboxylase [Elusimicrobiota bacterium]